MSRFDALLSRRDYLKLAVSVSVSGWLGNLARAAANDPKRKRSCILLWMNGGPSHVDTWDYKPELEKRDGQELAGFNKFTGFFANEVGGLMKSPFKFSPQGKCGLSTCQPPLAKRKPMRPR